MILLGILALAGAFGVVMGYRFLLRNSDCSLVLRLSSVCRRSECIIYPTLTTLLECTYCVFNPRGSLGFPAMSPSFEASFLDKFLTSMFLYRYYQLSEASIYLCRIVVTASVIIFTLILRFSSFRFYFPVLSSICIKIFYYLSP